jgi:hypothetical protein
MSGSMSRLNVAGSGTGLVGLPSLDGRLVLSIGGTHFPPLRTGGARVRAFLSQSRQSGPAGGQAALCALLSALRQTPVAIESFGIVEHDTACPAGRRHRASPRCPLVSPDACGYWRWIIGRSLLRMAYRHGELRNEPVPQVRSAAGKDGRVPLGLACRVSRPIPGPSPRRRTKPGRRSRRRGGSPCPCRCHRPGRLSTMPTR